MAKQVPTPATISRYLIDNRPDWSKIDFDLECPRCGYNLHMLESARCPECGLDIVWHNLLDARFNRSTFLFEHHWRTRPFGSWIETALRSFLPWRFWKQISLYDRVRAGPLWFCLLTAPFLCMFSAHGLSWLAFLILDKLTKGMPTSQLLSMLINALENMAFPNALWNTREFLIPHICFFGMLIGSLGLLLLLRQTLGRCRVRAAQVLRVVAYSSYPIALITPWWFLLVALLGQTLLVQWLGSGGTGASDLLILANRLLMIAAVALPAGAILGFGLKRYLRLPRPFVLGITASFVGLFAGIVSMFVWSVWK